MTSAERLRQMRLDELEQFVGILAEWAADAYEDLQSWHETFGGGLESDTTRLLARLDWIVGTDDRPEAA